ncbi:MAG: hypothetical protein ABIU54_01725 [Candidatus Eisenbacteria bacterium]
MRPRFLASIATLMFVSALVAVAANAAEGITGLEGMTSTVFQKHQSSFSGIGIRLRIQSAQLLPNVELRPSIEYWRNAISVDDFQLSASRRDATLGGDAVWLFPLKSRAFEPYLGAGFALHFLSSEAASPQIPNSPAENSVQKGAFSLAGGLRFGREQRFGNFIEVEYHMVPQAQQLKLHFGLNWNIGVTPPAK